MRPADLWASFSHDPRVPAHARLRASDADREVVRQALADAFADGRLDAEELETRSEAAAAARTLGELPALVGDLTPAELPGRQGIPLSASEIEHQAIAAWHRNRRQAVWTFFSASLVCWVIWFATGLGSQGWDAPFPWPLFVMLGTGLHAARLQWQRDDLIAEERRRLERKRDKQLRAPRNPWPRPPWSS